MDQEPKAPTYRENIEPCYLCGASYFTDRKGTVRDDSSLRVVECGGCGLVTLSSREHIRAGHYEGSGMHGEIAPSVDAWLRQSEIDDERRVRMLQSALTNRRVLDVGSGACGFVRKAQAFAREIAAVEPERRIAEYWAGEMTIYPSIEAAGDGYDLITAFHVVEHLPQPRETLKSWATRLAPGGRLVIEVPNAEDALLTLYECDAFQRFTYWSQHLFLFNADTMRQLATQAGLRVASVQQYQRYPLSNHMHWLSQGKPGGHQRWSFLDTDTLSEAYAASLAAIGKCDTIVTYLERAS